MANVEDYYHILGVEKTSTDKEIQRAYRKLAHKYHPDSNDSKEAEEKFKKVNEAYNTLKDPEKRKAYDQYGSAWESGRGFNSGDFSGWSGNDDTLRSVFESIFRANNFGGGAGRGGYSSFNNFGFGGGGFRSQPSKGQDMETSITISIEEAYLGGSKQLQFNVNQNGQLMPKHLDISIPKQISKGKKIRLRGQGAPGVNGGPAGDILIKIDINDDSRYSLKELDIYRKMKITPWQAAFGDKVTVEVFGKKIELKIPSGTQSNQHFRLKGKGLKDKLKVGNLYLVTNIVMPEHLSKEEEKLLKQWKKISEFTPEP